MTITEIKKLGNTKQKRALRSLRHAKLTTKYANISVSNEGTDSNYNIQEMASNQYCKVIKNFAETIGVSENEATELANKLKV